MKPIYYIILLLILASVLLGCGTYALVQQRDWVKGGLCLVIAGVAVYWGLFWRNQE